MAKSVTKREISLKNRADQQMIRDIQTLESFAHARGLHVTAHALNRAKNALGWEVAGDVEQAAKASFALA
jgi:hypothetical protein